MKKILAIVLSLIMLLGVLVSCTENNTEATDNSNDKDTNDVAADLGNDDDTESETDASTDEYKPIELIPAGTKTDYVIAYYVNLSDECKALVEQLAEKMNAAYPGIEITTEEVWPDFQLDVHEHEILIGNTGRAESKDAASLVEDYRYIIKLYENKKLVIYGANDMTVKAALEHFIETYATTPADSLIVDENLEKIATVNAAKRAGWVLNSIPTYRGGTSISIGYETGHGLNLSNTSAGGKMQIASGTTSAEYDTYIQQLKDAGYTETTSHKIGANKYAQYKNSKNLVYVYYTDSQKEVRIIHDKASTPENDFEYSYTPKSGDTSTFYQYALMCHPQGHGGLLESTGYDNAGLCDVIKLADNSVILIDGGDDYQATDAAVDGLMSFLRTVTGKSSGKIRIAAIFLTHGHGDHVYLTSKLIKQYSNQLTVERAMYNFRNIGDDEFSILGSNLEKKYPDIKFAKLHTGQKIQLANATFEVIYTHEDMVNSKGMTEISDYNNTSTVLKMTMNGKTMMILGDVGGAHGSARTDEYNLWETQLFATFCPSGGTNYLKCDAVQVSHHALNAYMNELYKKIDPDMAFIPAVDIATPAHDVQQSVWSQMKSLAGVNNMFCAGRYTYGWDVSTSGTISIRSTQIKGANSDYWGKVTKYSALHSQSGTKF